MKESLLPRHGVSAGALSILLLLAGCHHQKVEKSTSTGPIPRITTIAPSIGNRCLEFAMQLGVGFGKQIADSTGRNTYYVTNLGETPTSPNQSSTLSQNTVELKHINPDTEQSLYFYNYQGRYDSFKDGSTVRIDIQQTDTDVDSIHGSICAPTPI